MSSTSAGPSLLPPPLRCLQRDDYAAADKARLRLSKHKSFLNISLSCLHRRKSRTSDEQSQGSRESSPPTQEVPLPLSPDGQQVDLQTVHLDDNAACAAALDENYDKDVYRWAILYENQRGATIFSTPYYSPMSLLPVDPPAFTIPSTASSPSAAQPTVSLTDYPLPDGTWRWVSRAWMIDMHGDGQVQYDGFEYNWFFRSKNWRPEVSFMSTGGFVRRRRWLRLMMRPAQVREGTNGAATSDGFLEVPLLEHHEGASRPPSVTLSAADDTNNAAEIWKGDEGDWNRCHAALKRLRRDGRKLELWQRWLGVMLPQSSANSVAEKGEDQEKRPQLSTNDSRSSSHTSQDGTLAADSGARTNQAPVKCISTVIRAHGSDILQLFIYPDSRAKFLDILARSGLLPELQAGLGVSKSMHVLDFWSYTQCLTDGSTNSDDV